MNYMPTKAERRWQGKTPPNYVAVYAWRQRRLIQIRERPAARGYALAYYADKPGEFINDWCDTVDPRNAGTDKLTVMPMVLVGRELDVLAAVVLGGTSITGGTGSVPGTALGLILLAVIQNGMNLTGVESYDQQIVLGGIIVLAVLLDRLKAKGR